MKKLSPSILSADFSRLAEEILAIEKAGADYLHIDVMDGHFVPNITVGPFIVEAIKRITRLPLDVHLMIDKPEKFIKAFADAGSDIITVHAEATRHLSGVLRAIKKQGARAGVSINPLTPVETIEPILEEIDLVLIMSVNPGFSGQEFIKNSLKKIEKTKILLDKMALKTELEVDGGIKTVNIGDVSRAGANVFVAGSAIFGSPDYKKTITEMRKEIEKSAQP